MSDYRVHSGLKTKLHKPNLFSNDKNLFYENSFPTEIKYKSLNDFTTPSFTYVCPKRIPSCKSFVAKLA